MASLTGGFAPIAGAGGSKDKGGGKKSDLTGGLISIGDSNAPSRGKSEDVDFGDFDVDDLLLDDGGGAGAKSKSKGKSKSPTSSPKKKKGSSGGSKKKDKSKKKHDALTSFNDEDEDWATSPKARDDGKKTTKSFGFDVDDYVAPVKKNTRLDDEFARMLGLEDELGDVQKQPAEFDALDLSGRRHDRSEPPVHEGSAIAEEEVKEPRTAEENVPTTDAMISGGGGLDTSFFQDEIKTKTSGFGGPSTLSFLTAHASERRGGRGTGRRQGGDASDPIFADPFGKPDPTKRAGGLDDLFSSSRSSKADPAKEKAPRSTFESLFGAGETRETKAPQEPRGVDTENTKPVFKSASSDARPQSTAAADDLLAELLASEKPTKPQSSAPPKDENTRQDDLLAELFPDVGKSHKQDETRASEPQRTAARESSPPPSPPQTSSRAPESQVETAKFEASRRSNSASVSDVDSARDSLLKDLLPESPPRSRRPRPQDVARSDGVHPPPATATKPPEPESPSPLPSPSPAKPKAASPTSQVQPPTPQKPQPPSPPSPSLPSPGKTKTIALGTPSKVREVEFEQSKDELLEEILSSAPPSPARPTQDAPGSPLSSYSLTFDQDPPLATPESPLSRRRPSRSPEKAPSADTTALAASPSPPRASEAPQTVYVRDHHAEDELKKQHTAAMDAARKEHEAARDSVLREKQELTQRLAEQELQQATQAAQCELHKAQLQSLHEQLSLAHGQHARVASDLQALQAQHALQQAQSQLWEKEKATLTSQLDAAVTTSRTLLQQLTEEKQAHQHTQLAFGQFKRETEQAAQLQTQKERAQMDRLFHQLQNSLVQMQMLQEQTSEDATARREIESATRMRMISSLEVTSRQYACQTQDECHKLTALLGNLEATLRAYRQEHLEEKERLRQEQMRLNVLSQHFQAQTSVLHEKSDANAQLLASYLSHSLQDVRVAEARLATRRQQLAQDEQKLFDERAAFAGHREEWLEQQQRVAATLERERTRVEQEWRALQREREDLDDVIASHEDAFRALKEQREALECEKERVAVGALHVAEMAHKFEVLTRQLVEKERELALREEATHGVSQQWAAREQSVVSERKRLEEREARLHAQLKQMETMRKKVHDERRRQSLETQRQRLPAKAPEPSGVQNHVVLSDRHSPARFDASARPPAVSSVLESPPLTQTPLNTLPPSSAVDPSGFSASFRQLVEDNWQKQQWGVGITDAALRKERMWIHSLGLDTSRKDSASQQPSRSILHSQATVASTPATRSATLSSRQPPVASSKPPPPPPVSSSTSVSMRPQRLPTVQL